MRLDEIVQHAATLLEEINTLQKEVERETDQVKNLREELEKLNSDFEMGRLDRLVNKLLLNQSLYQKQVEIQNMISRFLKAKMNDYVEVEKELTELITTHNAGRGQLMDRLNELARAFGVELEQVGPEETPQSRFDKIVTARVKMNQKPLD